MGSRAKNALRLLPLLLLICEWQAAQAQAQAAPISPAKQRTIAPGPLTQVQRREVPSLYWMSGTEALRTLKDVGLKASFTPAVEQWAVVIKQSPLPGTAVTAGSQVMFELGRPELTIASEGGEPTAANQPVVFTLRFQPALPQRAAAPVAAMAAVNRAPVYSFYCGEVEQPCQSGPADHATHAFVPGWYLVYGAADILGQRFYSMNKKLVVVRFDRIVLDPPQATIKAGGSVGFSAQGYPAARANASLNYCFEWGDGTPEFCTREQPAATHRYQSAGSFKPFVTVRLSDGISQSSEASKIEVAATRPVPPPPQHQTPSQVPTPSATVSPTPGKQAYAASLEVPGGKMESHVSGRFMAHLKPPAPRGIRVTYCFIWDDGTAKTCGDSAAEHAYSWPGKYSPQVEVSFSGEQQALSQAQQVSVAISWADILWSALIGIATIVICSGGYKAVKLFKAVWVKPHPGIPKIAITSTAPGQESTVVRIRCVVPAPKIRTKERAGHV